MPKCPKKIKALQCLKKKKKREIAEAVDRILSLPPVSIPEDYQQWETKYLKMKYSH